MGIMPMLSLKDKLNPKQYEAVACPPGPLLIFAGAGSGKTRVLTYRIAFMIKQLGINPGEILAVTFTNKAAQEMRERLLKLLDMEYLPLLVLTFHSFGARILREYYEVISYKKNFSIYDEDESIGIIKGICKDLQIEEGGLKPSAIKHYISRAKDEMIDPVEYAESANLHRQKIIGQIYIEYQKRLRLHNGFDFDDLIYWPVKIFDGHPDILQFYRRHFKHLLIDEYQDTSISQYQMVKHLAGEHKSVTVVGDDDQSIYGWRGADITNILNFERDFPGAKVVKLEQNYRSTQNILSAASALIANNLGRKSKALWTSLGEGQRIKVIECSDAESESLSLVEQLTHLRKSEGLKYSDFAVLYRTNAQSRSLEDGFRTSGIPYIIVGGLRFYERMEIKDILAYLKILVNPDDNISTQRIINVPRRGIGDVSIDYIANYSRERNLNLLTGCYHATEGKVDGIPAPKIKEFTKIIDKLSKLIDSGEPLASLLAKIIELSGYEASLVAEATPQSETRLDNIKELVDGAAEFENRTPDATPEQFLEEVALITDMDRRDPNSDAVTMMTLHGAKGLEFPVVFITGLEEGLFPLIRDGQIAPKDLEEERRLMYVGMTRAQRHLYLTHCRYRRHFNRSFFGKASRFLSEIPENTLDDAYVDLKPISNRPKTKLREGRYEFEAEPKRSFAIGADVYHQKFGYGVILGIEGNGENEIVTISFSSVGRKKLMVKMAGLKPA